MHGAVHILDNAPRWVIRDFVRRRYVRWVGIFIIYVYDVSKIIVLIKAQPPNELRRLTGT